MKPGIYYDISNSDYHAADGISCSGLKLIDKGPTLYKHRYIDGNHPDTTPAMVFGSAAHKQVLEPKSFSAEFAVAPEINRRTKAGKAEWAEFESANSGKTIIKKEDHETVKQVAEAVHAHPVAGNILSDGFAEASIFLNMDDGTLVKIRPDWMTEDLLVDLKTADDASPQAFSRACYNYGYHIQAGLYLQTANAVMDGRFNNFVFIVVEKKPPYQVAVYVADREMVEFGMLEASRLLGIYRRCMESGEWPGINGDKVATINLPGWAYKI